MTRLPKWLLVAVAVALMLGLASPALAVDKVKDIASDGSSITVSDNGKDRTFKVTDKTWVILQNGSLGKVRDLKKNQDVALLFDKLNDGTFKATAILDKQGQFADAWLATGSLKQVSADKNEMVVTGEGGKDFTFTTGPKTKFELNNKSAKLSDWKQGDRPIIVYQKSGDRAMVLAVIDRR